MKKKNSFESMAGLNISHLTMVINQMWNERFVYTQSTPDVGGMFFLRDGPVPSAPLKYFAANSDNSIELDGMDVLYLLDTLKKSVTYDEDIDILEDLAEEMFRFSSAVLMKEVIHINRYEEDPYLIEKAKATVNYYAERDGIWRNLQMISKV